MTATGAMAWARRNAVMLMATAAVIAFVAYMLVNTLRIYDERRSRLDAIERLAISQCQATNNTNDTVRFILSASVRQRSPDNPISPGLRQAYIDAFQRLPLTDCGSGEKTYFEPPFPPGA